MLPLLGVQLWQAKDTERLDRPHRPRARGTISCLVDATSIHTLNELKPRLLVDPPLHWIGPNRADSDFRVRVYALEASLTRKNTQFL